MSYMPLAHLGPPMRAVSRHYGSLQQSHATETSKKKDGMTPHAFHILESRRTKQLQTMKLVLALAGTAAAFVAPVREQRLVQAVSP